MDGLADQLTIDVERAYRGGPTVVAAFDVPLDPPGITVLFGPSGSGKTTILRCIAGLERPDRGRVTFDGETWSNTDDQVWVDPGHRRVGLLHQEYALFPHLTVRKNVGYGLRRTDRVGRADRVADLLHRFSITELADRRPGQLSGGERQRVALARTVAPGPRLLLLDEPLSALDSPTRDRLRGELRRLLVDLAVPAIVVTHDRAEALSLGDRMIVVIGGRVRQIAPVDEVFTHPADLEVAAIVGVESVIPARVRERADGLLRLEAAGRQLIAVDTGIDGDEVFACIRAEEVVLRADAPVAESARNQLRATIVEFVREGPLLRVRLDAGFELAALITPQALEELDLRVGTPLLAVVKAPSVHCVARTSRGEEMP
jgi:molybdate transport system ATP-binding protein